MRGFMTVLRFEVMHYFKNKVFLISTVVLIGLVTIGLSIPTIIEAFDKESDQQENSGSNLEQVYGVYDPQGFVEDLQVLQLQFSMGELVAYSDENTLNQDVLSSTIAGGFSLISTSSFEYVVVNNEMNDHGMYVFTSAYTQVYQQQALKAAGINYKEFKNILYPQIESNLRILGKDSTSNYGYTYILVFGLYFMIIMYGQLIATAVASEKSNRTMEILVTSTKTTYLIFGKVIGGAIASIIQFGLIIATGLLVYKLNGPAWQGQLDPIFNIPGQILLQFAVFGTLGYLLFTFIFGTLGALVSKTEDINASATPITLLFVAVFMVAMVGMQNTEGIVLKIASFIPFSSFLAMFVRVSMGSVSWIEVTISLTLLIATTLFTGWLGAKIYRMGTLMYGNPVKFKDIPKILKSQ